MSEEILQAHTVQIPLKLHDDTKSLVTRFAEALAAKLRAAEVKYGYSAHWQTDGWLDECREKLEDHLRKGDPRDVAAYCAFLWHHNEPTYCETDQHTFEAKKRAREADAEIAQLRQRIHELESEAGAMRAGFQDLIKSVEANGGLVGYHSVILDRARQALQATTGAKVAAVVEAARELVAVDHLREGRQFEQPKTVGEASWVWRTCRNSASLKDALAALDKEGE